MLLDPLAGWLAGSWVLMAGSETRGHQLLPCCPELMVVVGVGMQGTWGRWR